MEIWGIRDLKRPPACTLHMHLLLSEMSKHTILADVLCVLSIYTRIPGKSDFRGVIHIKSLRCMYMLYMYIRELGDEFTIPYLVQHTLSGPDDWEQIID